MLVNGVPKRGTQDLRDEVGHQLILHHRNFIFQPQFAFFESRHLNLIAATARN